MANQNFKVKNGLEVGPNNSGIGTIITTTSGGFVGVGSTNPTAKLDVTGSVKTSSQLISTVPTGTSPLSVNSTTVVANLNADLLDGVSWGNVNTNILTSGTVQGTQLISSVSTGTSPLTVTSTTAVTNLNADLLDGQHGSYYLNYNNLSNTPTLGDGTLSLGVSGTGLSGSGSFSANQSGNSSFTVTLNSSTSGTSNIVARDGSGNFSAGTITANLTGNVTGNVTGTVTGSVTRTVTGTNSAELVRGNMASSDFFRILVGGTNVDEGYVEIATADGGNEPIHVRQYTGTFSTITRTATLLDSSGFTIFPKAILLGATSATASVSRLVVQGTGTDAAGPGIITLARGTSVSSVTTGLTLGRIDFNAKTEDGLYVFGRILTESPTNASTGNYQGTMIFMTSASGGATESFRINSSQEVLIGYTSDNGAYRLQVNGQIFAANPSIAPSDGRYKENVETLSGGIDIVKSLRPVSFNWKPQQDITSINEEGEEVILRPAHNFPEGKTVGFIAQEVQSALDGNPWIDNLIKKNRREAVVDKDGNEIAPEEEFYGIADDNLIPILTSALKEAIDEIEKLKARLDDLGI